MNVGIMTWFSYHNYGSALQACALARVIGDLGYEALMIDYPPKGRVEPLLKIDGKYLVGKAVRRLKEAGRETRPYASPAREDAFDAFLSARLTRTPRCETFTDLYLLNKSCAAFVCGSDQIWSPLCFDEKYFLNFAQPAEKAVAYAPSIGASEIADPAIAEKMKRLLERFPSLSVREAQGAALIKELTGREAKVVLDPSLLLTAEKWTQFVPQAGKRLIADDYAVCYFLGDSARYDAYVRKMEEAYGVPVYVIPVTEADRGRRVAPFDVGPAEFLSLIRYAKHVCTDSFHGLALSVLFGTPFTVFKRFADDSYENQNSRIFNILRLLSLEERLADPADPSRIAALAACDFSRAHLLLDKLRQESLAYLADSLNAAVRAGETRRPRQTVSPLCCGCGACAAACPKNAISLRKNEDGFISHVLDPKKCVNCGLCEQVCPFVNASPVSLRKARALFAGKAADRAEVRRSSSGGAAHALARFMAGQGAYVAGCAYDPHTDSASHVIVPPEDGAGLDALRGSKYLQSDIAPVMREVLSLAKRKKVLLVCLPCQAAGADLLLRRGGVRENVLLADLICHGVPSSHLWTRYLEERAEKDGVGPHPAASFRSENGGWRRRTLELTGAKSYRREERKDDFYAFFRRGFCDMKTCFDCPFRASSAADLRLGDYWGDRFLQDGDGVSMIVAVTPAGENAVRALTDAGLLKTEAFPLEEYWSVQFPYNRPEPVFRETLLRDLREGRRPLSALREAYCSGYDTYEKLSGLKKKLLR